MIEKIVELVNKEKLSLDDKVELLDELYWAEWDELDKEYPEEVEKIFYYLENKDLEIEELAKALSLYNNVAGAHTHRFANIIADYYTQDRIKFMKALNMNKDQAIHLVYIFRNLFVFDDKDKELSEIKSKGQLIDEELEAAETFYSMYNRICIM